MSLRARALNIWLRTVEKPRRARAAGPEALRKMLDQQSRVLFRMPRGMQKRWLTLEEASGRIEALEIVPQNQRSTGVVLYIHGGAFVFGSPGTHAAMAAALAKRLGARVIMPKYRLAPENPYPAAKEDIRAAWDALLAQGIGADQIVVGGDSAGGALALGLLADLTAAKATLPAATFGFSPLTDLSYSGDSFKTNARSEAILSVARAEELRQMYIGAQPAACPEISPLFADFTGATPVWLTVGDTEILCDDSRRMAQRLTAQGVEVTFDERQDLPHVWPLFHNSLPEARETLDQLAGWIRRQPGWPAES